MEIEVSFIELSLFSSCTPSGFFKSTQVAKWNIPAYFSGFPQYAGILGELNLFPAQGHTYCGIPAILFSCSFCCI